MPDSPDSSNSHAFSRPFVLRNGTTGVVRVLRPDDRDRIATAFSKLEPESIYTRFFSMKKSLSDAELTRISTPDFVNYLALVASVGSGSDETLIGGASYTVLPAAGGERAAEVAFTIEEDYHGQGLASQLLAMLAEVARQHGISCFVAEVLAENAAMRSVFDRSGLKPTTTRQDGVIHYRMALPP